MTSGSLARDRDIRSLKDRMSRRILAELEANHIQIASSTCQVVGLPPIKVQLDRAARRHEEIAVRLGSYTGLCHRTDEE